MHRTHKQSHRESQARRQGLAALLVLMAVFVGHVRPMPAYAPADDAQPPQLFSTPSKPTSAYQFVKQMPPYMQVNKLKLDSSNNVTCNDGSPIGYYMRLNNHSKSWIIYLQGGGFCGSEQSCEQRWHHSPGLMSSNFWPKTKFTVGGILSSEPKENPYLWNANHIYVPYCSSDSWTGLSPVGTTSSRFAFMGSRIVERVLESLYDDLPRNSSLHQARFVLLAGDSAGATGVIMNLDKVSAYIEHRHQRDLREAQQLYQDLRPWTTTASDWLGANGEQMDAAQMSAPVFRGLADSGWFLDNEPFEFFESSRDLAAPSTTTLDLADPTDCDQRRCSPSQSIEQAMRFWNGQVPQACAAEFTSEPWRCYFGYRAYPTLKTPLFVVQWLYDEAQLMADNVGRPDSSHQWSYVDNVVQEMRASLENVTAIFAPSCLSHSLVLRKSWNQININGFKLPHILNSWEEQSLLDMATTASSTVNTAAQDTASAEPRSPKPAASLNSLGAAMGIIGRAQNNGNDCFRFIDSCSWPQCNRDCPSLD